MEVNDGGLAWRSGTEIWPDCRSSLSRQVDRTVEGMLFDPE